MDEEQIDDLLTFYALGSLSPEDTEIVESYLETHPEARLRYQQMADSADALALSTSPVLPSQRTKTELMARIQADLEASGAASRPLPASPASPTIHPSAPERAPARFALPSLAFALAGFVLAAVAIAWAFSLRAEIGRLQDANRALQGQLQTQQALLVQIASPNSTSTALSGTEAQPGASGVFFADPGRPDGVLILAGLPPLEAGQTYQLWMIQGDQPSSAGLFNTDSEGRILLPVQAGQAVGSYDTLGVSIEPQEGSQSPTGDIVILSPLAF